MRSADTEGISCIETTKYKGEGESGRQRWPERSQRPRANLALDTQCQRLRSVVIHRYIMSKSFNLQFKNKSLRPCDQSDTFLPK